MIRFLTDTEPLPWDLLLDADPNRDFVEEYLKTSEVLVYDQSGIKGVVVYQNGDKVEIMNLAVSPESQGQGIGRQLMEEALLQIEKTYPKKSVLIKTGDISSPALKLYQSLGFKEIAKIENYFVDHYPEPIYEGGCLLKHQIILEKV